MEEKKVTKISLSTFFLILAVIAICIMGYFLYVSSSKIADMILSEKELNAEIAKLENEITSEQTQIKANNINSSNSNSKEMNENQNTVATNITFSSLSGIYVGDKDVEPGTTPFGETEIRLYLYEDGGFYYNDTPGLSSGYVGYYTFNENDVVLHKVLECANDIGRDVVNETSTFKINNDNSITDSEINVVLKKSSNKNEEEVNIISRDLRNALDNNSLE